MQSVTINRILMDNPRWQLQVYEYYGNWYAIVRDGLDGNIEYSSRDSMSPIQAIGQLRDDIVNAEQLRLQTKWEMEHASDVRQPTLG